MHDWTGLVRETLSDPKKKMDTFLIVRSLLADRSLTESLPRLKKAIRDNVCMPCCSVVLCGL